MNNYRFEDLPILDDNEYVLDWKDPVYIGIGEHQVITPRVPAKKYILNYNKPQKHQKFQRTFIDKNLKKSAEEEKIIRREYHRRYHGVWFMLNGEPYYINGRLYDFLNYWTTQQNRRPDFRIEAWEFYTLWYDVYMDMDACGVLDYKCRRLGDTEKALHIMLTEMHRYRHTSAGMQNIHRNAAKKNYLRLVNGHRRYPWWLRPKSRGTTIPQSVLELSYPEEKMTAKGLRGGGWDDEEEVPSNGSTADYEATEFRAYDGTIKHVYHGDEYGKIRVSDMHIIDQWDVIKRCMSMYNDAVFVGNGLITTTVEDVDGDGGMDAGNVELAQKLWDLSDPKNLVNGRTLTGLKRIFRGYQYGADIDEYGFHKIEEATRRRDAEIAAMRAIGDFEGIMRLQRKQPASVEEALQVASLDCTLLPHLIDAQVTNLRENPPVIRRGNLVWIDGRFGGSVEWVEDPQGKWYATQMPVKKNARGRKSNGDVKPGNDIHYSIGADPIDSGKDRGTGSDGAIVVFRKFNIAMEPNVILDDQGLVTDVKQMLTDQFVCIYGHRPDDPYEYFEDALKTAIFWGAPIFFELDKPYAYNKFRETGFRTYLQYRPKETITSARTQGRTKDQGAKATGEIISLYVDALRHHVANRWQTYRLMPLLQDMRKFNTKNRTERDLSVAAGYALLGAMDSRMKKGVQEERDKWDDPPWRTYKTA